MRRGALDELKALSCLVCKAGRGRRGGRRVWWIDWLVGVGVGLRCTAPPSVDGLQLCRCRLHGRTQRIRSDTSDALIAAAKEVATFDSPRRSLTTSAAACRTWHAALLLLRSGFIADKNLGDVDVPMPGRRPSSTSHAISFVWRPVTTLVDSILCVEYIRGRQRKRRTEEARLFCEELGKVLTFLQTPSPASSHISVPLYRPVSRQKVQSSCNVCAKALVDARTHLFFRLVNKAGHERKEGFVGSPVLFCA